MTPDQLSERYSAYRWLVERGLVGWEPFTQLQPWYLLPANAIFRTDLQWLSTAEAGALIVFARRQDNDDLAALKELPNGGYRVLLLEGWTQGGNSYEVTAHYDTLWAWLKHAVDDIAVWHSH